MDESDKWDAINDGPYSEGLPHRGDIVVLISVVKFVAGP
jgi:hypothetical protein